jgi:hypothetical protein
MELMRNDSKRIIGIAVGVCAVSTSLLVGLRWVIKSYLAELKPKWRLIN